MSLKARFMSMAAKGVSSNVIELNDIPASIVSIIVNGGNLPQCSYRMHSNGQGQTAIGDNGSALVYSQFGDDWLISGLNSAFECEFIQTGVSGQAGTLSGAPLSTFQILSTLRVINWQKDTNAIGSAIWNGTVEIREIALPANTTGAAAIQMTCETF